MPFTAVKCSLLVTPHATCNIDCGDHKRPVEKMLHAYDGKTCHDAKKRSVSLTAFHIISYYPIPRRVDGVQLYKCNINQVRKNIY